MDNQSIDSPSLNGGYLKSAIQILGWLLFSPTKWRRFISSIDPELPAHFSLLQVNRTHLQNPEMRKLLISGYVVIPILASFLIGLPHLVLYYGGFSSPKNWGVFGILGGILEVNGLLSVVLGVGGGILGGSLNVVAGALVDWLVPSLHAVGIRPGVGHDSPVSGLCAALAGFSLGFATHARLQLSKSMQGVVRSIGSVVVGLLIGSAAIVLTMQFGQSIWGELLGLAGISTALGFSLQRRGSTWTRGFVMGLGGCLGFVAVFTVSTAVVNLLMQTGSFRVLLADAFERARETVPVLLLFVPAMIGEVAGGATAGALGGMIGGAGGWLALSIITGAAPPWPTIPIGLACILLAFTMPILRPLMMYPFVSALGIILLQLEERRIRQQRSLLRFHAAFWDEEQRLPLPSLDDYLVLVSERNPEEGHLALTFISRSHQHWAAQEAQVELDARMLERCCDLDSIAQVHRKFGPNELTGPASLILRSLARISQDIAATLEQSEYNQRSSFRTLAGRTDGLQRELFRSSEPRADRFIRILESWQKLFTDRERSLAEQTARRQEIESPYVIGLPLNEEQAVFVGRAEVAVQIEQLLLQPQRPPLLLYGQRGVGKTSLLRNLRRLLPSSLIPLFIDLQGPATRASNEAGFLYNLAKAMTSEALKHRELRILPLTRELLATDPFTIFEQWLDSFAQQLGGAKAILLLDEFEQLEHALLARQLDHRMVLGMLRHIIQHKPEFRVLLAGSHMLDEMNLWSGYLINVQIVKIGNLTREDALQLVIQPVQGYKLAYHSDAVELTLRLTGRHPYLLQLLCDCIVRIKNSQALQFRGLVNVDDVELAVPKAIMAGNFFFNDLENNQIDEMGRSLLYRISQIPEQAVYTDADCRENCGIESSRAITDLLAIEILENFGNGYRFQSILVRRWFSKSATGRKER